MGMRKRKVRGFWAGLVCIPLVLTGAARALDVAVPHVQADFLWAKGYTGVGVEIGVLDVLTADSSHAAISGNFVGGINFAKGPAVEGPHATQVAGAAASQDSIYPGVAPGAGWWTAQTAKRNSTTTIRDQTIAAETFGRGLGALSGNPVEVITLSIGVDGDTSALDQWSLALDHIVNTNGRTITVSAGNDGPGSETLSGIPSGAFNAIIVGATGGTGPAASQDYSHMASYSSRGPTTDGRAKPDIVAPGSMIHLPTLGGAWSDVSGTSFAAPIVAGGAALLIDMGQALGHSTDPKVIKSVLLNSADKLAGWTHTPIHPLDYAQGAGQMNLRKAYSQYLPAEQASGAVHAVGWDAGEIASGAESFYSIGMDVPAGKIISTTLTWDRIVTAGSEDIETVVYSPDHLDNLDLFVYSADDLTTPLAGSAGAADNVEHIYYSVTDPGRYVIGVRMAGAGPGDSEAFALAWHVLQDPSAGLLLGDMDGSGAVNNNDIAPFVMALTDLAAFEAAYGLGADLAGDIDGSGALNNNDIAPFATLLTTGSYPQAVPEPAALSLLALGALAPVRRRRLRRSRWRTKLWAERTPAPSS